MKGKLSKSGKGSIGLLLIVMLWLANVLPALAQQQDTDVVPGEVLVKFKAGTTSTTKAGVGRSLTSKAMLNKGGLGYTKIELPTEADVEAVVAELKEDPNVEYAEPVYIRKASGIVAPRASKSFTSSEIPVGTNDEYYADYQWGLMVSGVPYSWDKVSETQRQNVTVAVLDTGVDFNHPDLQGNLIAGMDIINQDPYPFDFNGHGTHVAGIIGADTNNSIGIAGVADGVKIMPVKILDNGGMGTTADLVEGILWAVDHGADVINLSLGGESPSQYEQDAINYALDHNVVVVAAVGNESNNWTAGDAYDLAMEVVDNQTSYQSPVGYPAAYPGVIGVGAVDWLSDYGFNVADFSNVGPEVDLVAPGVDIYSTYIIDGYQFISGTSQATPFVSGLAALLLAADPSLTYEEVQRILEQTATDLTESPGEPGWDDYFGAGLIDGQWAFDLNRLKLNVTADNLDDATQVSVTSSVYDYKGALVDTAEAGALWVWNWDDMSQTFVPTPDLQGTVIGAVYGVGNYDFDLSVPGVYAMFVGNSSSTYYVGSEVQYVQKRPLAPQANLPAGTFTESQSIILTTQTTGAKIYYTLDGSNPTEESNLYTQPLSIATSKTVKAIAVMNGVYSAVAQFTYVIDLPATGGGGGGGGGGSTTTETTPALVTEADGSKTLPISVSEEDVDDLLGSGDDVTIDANSGTDYDNLELSLQGQLLTLAKQAGKKLIVDANDIDLTFDGDAFGTLKADAGLELAIERSTMTNPNGFAAVSSVFDFSLKIDDKAVSQFSKPLSIELNFAADKVENPNKLGVYYFNEKLGQWEYVGGELVDNNTISFATQHFSQYAVLEKQVAFKDLTNHWAKDTIEALVAKGIITGMTDGTFAPEAQVTRAELAVLLARALQPNEFASNSTFEDVAAANWYADSVSKVQAAGIINGVSNTSFAPNQVVDRQQMATMIMRAYAYKTGKQLDEIITTMEIRFSDEGVADSWARRNIVLADAMGLMQGYPDGKFMPKATLTRAEAAVVIKRLLDSLE